MGGPATVRTLPPGRGRHGLLAVAATVLAVAGLLAPARVPIAAAAADGLRLSTAATYTLVPSRHVVRVSVDITARNEKPNVTSGGIVTKYFYEGARIAIQTEATSIRATTSGVRLTATTTAADGFRVLEVRFRSAVFFGQTAKVRVTYDLPGGAPRSSSGIRVSTAFATFVAWGFGDSASVRVVIPAGFETQTSGSTVTRSTANGATILRATGIADISAWYLQVTADRKSALTTERIDLSGGEHVVVRAWPEDTEWRTRVGQLITKGLPELVRETGLDWPVGGDLSVFEVHTPLLEGYAGVFFVGQDRIEISEDLDDLTILHEASHAWFNRTLFDGRWITEGLADAYAAKTLEVVAPGGDWAPDRVAPDDPSAVRLVHWTHPGRITDDETDARERYGYNASWTVVRSLIREIGDDGMRKVFAAAQGHRIAYTAGPTAAGATAETVSGPNDWRRFLDLLEEVGGSRTADDLFRRWVVTDADLNALDKRAEARTTWAALVGAGGDWVVPLSVRRPLADWDFRTATTRMAEATAILARRDALVGRAAELGVTIPTSLRAAYEAGGDSFAEATRIADADEAALRALGTAIDAVAAERAPLVTLGLLGTAPELDLAAARAAFDAGQPDAAARAAAVTALIDGSVEIGRGRLLIAIAVVVAILILIVVAVVLIHRRRGRRGDLALVGSPDVAAPYATLADQSPRDVDEVTSPTEAVPATVDPASGTDGRSDPAPTARGDES